MLITNATIITWGENPRILTDHAIYVENGVILALGPTEVLIPHYRDVEIMDAAGQLVMPGNICAHTHFYGAYARGMAIPGPAPANFPEILEKLWWSLDKALNKDAVYMSAMVCLIDAIKHGTTTLFDHHASPNFIDGSLDVIAGAVKQSGLRSVLCYEVSDRDGLDKAEAGIAENVNFINSHQGDSQIAATFGLHAAMTLSDETLRACVDALPSGAGFHIHAAEGESDQQHSMAKHGKRVIQRLHDFGMLGEKSIAVHCVHVDDNEKALLKQSGTWVTHQPRSNMNNGVGAMDFDAMMADDMRVCLGNDGFSNNMWAEWKTAYLLPKVMNRDPRSGNGADIAKMAIDNNAQLARQFFPGLRLGELSEGAAADIIFVDYKPFTPLTTGNLSWHILFGFEASMVTTTIVNGRVLMRDRQLTMFDEKSIMNEAMALAPQIWEQYEANLP